MNPRLSSSSSRSNFFKSEDSQPVEWFISSTRVDYEEALGMMEQRAAKIAAGHEAECVWLLEHPALYTAGTSAMGDDLVDPDRFPVFKTGRGGKYTYHGPGQRVGYVMLDLKRRKQDVRLFVSALEQWLIDTLEQFNIKGERREDRVGVWVQRPEKPRSSDGSFREDKIAAIGIRLRKWVSFHGISLNIDPQLDHFDGIIACGIQNHGVTSFEDLGLLVSMTDVDVALKSTFETIFGPAAKTQIIQTP